VILDSSLNDALADGILGPDELLFSGSLEDESVALAVQLCLTEVDRQTCVWLSTPGGSPTGSWSYDTGGFQSGDWISQTLTIKGLDEAGNFSTPISRTYTVDTVAPVISATQTLEQVNLEDYQPGSTTAAPVLSGTVSDGSGVASLLIRLRQPDGSVITQMVSTTDGDWEYVPELSMPGDHILTVEAIDLAGNVASHAAFTLSVEGTAGQLIYLPLMIRK
ncbi:MAG: Ig-like domain-containing protein, partial [Chloroflexota bacterium]